MRRAFPVLIALLMVASIGLVPQSVAADDEWADSCATAETISPGTYSGRISPDDDDAFILEMDEGDFIQGSLSYNTERAGDIQVDSETEGRYPYASGLSLTAENE
jgi:hypothetical protein